MVITSTPFRISFFGGGTDYPVWYREHGGSVLSTTIDKCCYITCRWLPPFFEYHSRISYSRVENVSRNEAIQHPSVRACLEHLGIEEGVEIHHVADLPARTGLGTSSAFTLVFSLGFMRSKIRCATSARLPRKQYTLSKNLTMRPLVRRIRSAQHMAASIALTSPRMVQSR